MSLLANAHSPPALKVQSLVRRGMMGVALTARGRHRRAIPRGVFLLVVLPRRSSPCDAG